MDLSIRLVLLLVSVSAFAADTLRLRDGRSVNGQWLGGTARVVRMDVAGTVEEFEVSQVQSVIFDDVTISARQSPAVPADSYGPAGVRRQTNNSSGGTAGGERAAPPPASPERASNTRETSASPLGRHAPAEADNVTGVWEGTVRAARGPASPIRFEIVESALRVTGREFLATPAGPQRGPMAVVAVEGQINGSALDITEKEIQAASGNWCLASARLTLSPDGRTLMGTSDDRRCGHADLALTRDWTKSRQWEVCSSRAIADGTIDLLKREAASPGADRENLLAQILLGTDVKSHPLFVLNAHVVDQAFRPGTFTCSVNVARFIDAEKGRLFQGVLIQDDLDAMSRDWALTAATIASLLPDNHLVAVREAPEDVYEMTLISRFGSFTVRVNGSR
jgi:hypothetical protein